MGKQKLSVYARITIISMMFLLSTGAIFGANTYKHVKHINAYNTKNQNKSQQEKSRQEK